MTERVSIGFALTLAAGLCSGTCMLPLKFARHWRWENIWLVFSVVSLIVLPWALARAMVKNLFAVYAALPASAFATPLLFGAGWGIAQVLFGLSIARLGMALGYAIVIGLGALFGTIVPLLAKHPEVAGSSRGVPIFCGIAVMLLGVAVAGWAGRKREGSSTRNYGSALALAVLCGVLAPMLNYAYAFGDTISDEAVRQGNAHEVAGYAVWPVALLGGVAPNLAYAVFLLSRNRTWSCFRNSWQPDVWCGVVMGALWMGAFAVYGVGTVYLGKLGTSAGWALFQIFMIMTASCSGLLTAEWRGAPLAAKWGIGTSLLLLALATGLIAPRSWGANDSMSSKLNAQNVTRRQLFAAASLLAGSPPGAVASGQAATTQAASTLPASVTPQSEEQRTAWYREAKFGMFIHWGPYSLASVEASWPIMRPSKQFSITEQKYRSLSQDFNPAHFDPNAWVALAKSAGQRYMVFTTKHHDGFCMFDSAYTRYQITESPYGKDIVAQLAEACRRQGMPLGLYYSPPDMNHPAFRDTSEPASVNWHGEPTREVWPLYLHYLELQLRELLTRYGDVCLIWFDGLNDQRKYDGYRMQRVIREMQPQTLINNRIGIPGDYETPEQFLPTAIPVKGKLLDYDHRSTGTKPNYVPPPQDFRLWETCMTINGTWAYNKNDRDFKSVKELIRTLVEVASRGGNFLLNVGPEPDGTIQPEFTERLQAIGRWMDRNGESIYGTTYGPIQGVPSVRTTAKGSDVFVHIFDWPGRTIELVASGLPKFRSASLLASGERLDFRQQGGTLVLHLPPQAPDADVTVITMKGV